MTNPKNERKQAINRNLCAQIDKIKRHNRQGSFATKARYYSSAKVFCEFLAQEFSLEKFANVKDKHIAAYIQDMEQRGLKASSIKTNLSGIRFYHDFSGSKNKLSGNEKYELPQRQFGGVNRGWSDTEYKAFLGLCEARGRVRDKCVAILGRNDALRIHEACRIDRNDAEKAIASGILHVKGKGGKERDIPLSEASRLMLVEYITHVVRGQKLFVRSEQKTHNVIGQIKNFIYRNRDKYQDSSRSGANRTFHGLRHTKAAELYASCRSRGMNDLDARRHVSTYLGHERDDVTRIYLVK